MNPASKPSSSPPQSFDDTQPLTFEKVWLMFQETDRKFQETQAALAEQTKETDRKFQETQTALAEQTKETDRKFQETQNQIRETSRE
ncbi:MAG: hypothetical protein V1862_05585, partial [Methanobacteriota archaeon]